MIDEGQKSWTFTIKQAKYDDAHLFLDVADATGDGMAWAVLPTEERLMLPRSLHKWGKETKTRIMPGDALFGRKDGPPGHQVGAVRRRRRGARTASPTPHTG